MNGADDPQILLEHALAAYQAGQFEEALAQCEAALGLDGQRADAWIIKGVIARQKGALNEALEAYRQAIHLKPDYADAYNNLANILKEQGDMKGALAHYQQAITLQPNFASAWHNQALLLQQQSRHKEALDAFTQAVKSDPMHADAHWDRALSLLLQGHFVEGFQEYEWRWRRNQPPPRQFTQPQWRGEPLEGKTILIHSEQGFGDTLMFLRFLPLVVKQGGRILLEVQAELQRLLATLPDIHCIARGSPLPDFALHFPLLSLPGLFAITLETLPNTTPYLVPPLALTLHWRQRLEELAAKVPQIEAKTVKKRRKPLVRKTKPTPWLKVGLVWAGNANVKNDAIRSPRLQPLLPLLKIPGVCFFALQKGDGVRDLQDVIVPNNWIDLQNEIHDFADTAAILSSLDLIITTDTSVAHLAGALGTTGWVLLHHLPDWRWLLTTPESLWYPTLRLFRQTTPGGWKSVVTRIATALTHAVQGQHPRLSRPEQAQNCFRLAMESMGKNADQTAEAHCWQGLRWTPEAADGWTILGVLARRRQDFLSAEAFLRQASLLRPDYLDAFYHLARLFKQTKRLREAFAIVVQLCAKQPHHLDYLAMLVELAKETGEFSRALAQVTTAVQAFPDQAVFYDQLGNLYLAMNRLSDAEKAFRQAVLYQPNLYTARYNLGVTLQQMERYQDSIAAFEYLTQQNADQYLAWYGLGVACQRSGRMEQAESAYEQALQLKPNHLASSTNLASLYRAWGKLRKALEQHQKSLAIKPSFLEARIQLCHLRLFLCDWEGLEKELDHLAEEAILNPLQEEPPSPFPFLAFPMAITEAQQTQLARQYCQSIRVPKGTLPPFRVPLGGRLRIGYASADFHNHATAHLMLGLFKRHDRTHFEIFVYSWGIDDASHYRQRIMAECDHFADFKDKPSLEIAHAIRRDGIAILIDLKGHTIHSRPELFALRPAPVQVTYLGYPGSFGGDFMDYAIVDAFVVPTAQRKFYSESLLEMPHCYQVNDCDQPIAEPKPTRAECGLPEDDFIFCCFCSHYKIEPTVFGIWMRILQAVPRSILWLLEPFDTGGRANLWREAQHRQVDPTRILFAPAKPKEYHLSRLRHADLFLDTLYYNAHTTASDALWAGVPVLTTPGKTFASRVGASINLAAGLSELVVADQAAYEAKAIALATHDRESLNKIRQQLTKQRATMPLFDTELFAKNLEALYRSIWDRYQKGVQDDSSRS
ncbi:MAG: tetratricopeptide repeat protein [Magnetococcus sp. DMHC-6]